VTIFKNWMLQHTSLPLSSVACATPAMGRAILFGEYLRASVS
jgi:hypothetical protein